MNGLEIERKFLLKALPPEVQKAPGVKILQGYLANDEHREVRLRQHGRTYFLTVKEGTGLVRSEVEIRITGEQFRALWPSTEGCRLEKVRTAIRKETDIFEIDQYSGDLESLRTVEVEFESVEASARFKKPAYFGREVTEDEGYRNVALALHGIPHKSALKYEIGALPYLIKAGKLHLVLVTNSDRSRWIIPKGQPEVNMPRQDVAIMEAMEEAGVIGSFHAGLRAECRRKGQKTLHVYPLKVTSLLKKWPEMGWRKRCVLPALEAFDLISDSDLRRCVERLTAKIEA